MARYGGYQGKRPGRGESNREQSNHGRNGTNSSNTSNPKKWSAPTANHHDVAFSAGTRAKDAAGFTDTVRVLARHVSTSSTYKHGPVLALAMTDLQAPVYSEPTRPVRNYVCQTDTTGNTIVTNRMTSGKLNEPVDDDYDWSIETDSYKRSIIKYEANSDLWRDLNAQGHALVLQHCPDELETELRNQEAWAAIDAKRDVVALLVLIRDLQYNKTDRKRSIMATVEADFDLFSCSQEKNQSTDDYYKVFASCVDTINANGGQAGLHPAVFLRHQEAAIKKECDANNIDAVTLDVPAKEALIAKFEDQARESSSSEYLACLFLLLADNHRFKPLKREINNNFLMGGENGQYPKDVLSAKRLMTDFSPPVVAQPARERVPPTDVAFVKVGNEPIGDCYACGRKHFGGYKSCKAINDAKKAEVTKLVKAGHFDDQNEQAAKPEKRASRPPSKKQGAAFAAVQESDEESEGEESAKPTFEEFCREQGFIQCEVGTQKAWNGDTVSDLEFGLGFLHVGEQASPVTHGIVLAGANNAPIGRPDKWILVQESNKIKSPSKKIKTASTKTSSSTQVPNKPAWIRSLSKGFEPPQRVKTTRTNKRVAKVTTGNVPAASAKLATGNISVFNDTGSVPRKPARSGRAGTPLEGLGLNLRGKPRGTFKEPNRHQCHKATTPARKQFQTDSASSPGGGREARHGECKLPFGE